MHQTAMKNAWYFFNCYAKNFDRSQHAIKVLDIGSQDVNGSLKSVCPKNFEYIGVDFAQANGVDIILDDPYTLPFESNSVDIVLSSSCFEHSEMFWIIFLEILRVLKPNGLFYLNVPSNGNFHRYPVDCWRFYPDSGRALVTWAKKNHIDAALLESYTSPQENDIWNDFTAVFLKDAQFLQQHPDRIIDQNQSVVNALRFGSDQFINLSSATEDQQKLARLLARTSPQSSQVTQPSTSPETAEHLAASHYSHYEALCAEGKEAEGIEWLLKLAKEKNVHWRVLTALAQFAEKNGDDSLALDYYTQAKEKNPTPTPEDIPYAKLLIKLAKHERANTCLLSYRQSFPYDAEALALLKTCQQAQQQQQIRDYHRWQEQRLTGGLQADDYQKRVANLWSHQPLFEFFLILTPGHEAWLADSIDSLAEQYYDGWRLSIFAPSPSPDPEFLGAHAAVRWIHIAEEAGLVEAINQRLNASKAEWVAFFPCGARFTPELLLNIADYSAIHPEWLLIYTDEDQFGHDEVRSMPRFKPDFNLEFMRSIDYVGSFFVQRSALLKAGAYSNHQGAENYDIFLRVADLSRDDSTNFPQIIGHIPAVLYHLPEALAITDQAKSEKDEETAASALREHLARRGINAQVQPGLIDGVTRRVFYMHAAEPLVSIIIPTKNRLDLLNACIESIIKLTRYSNWELILVDNASDMPEIKPYYALLQQTLPGRVSIIYFPGEFNYSAMNNLAANQARGEYLLLLNNDTECIHDDWLDALLSHAQRPDVGMVGARLLYPKTLNLQHAGMVLGMGGNGTAHHVFMNMPYGEPGYMNRAQLDQEYSAVTGACQLLRKALYLQVGGLSDKDMKVLSSDVDLCLKVAELGYRIIWTPFATLLHHGSASLQTTPQSPEFIACAHKDQQQFLKRWHGLLSNDHAWNRNLSLANLMPAVESELIAAWNPDFRDKPRILICPSASDGIREYRNLAPLRTLHATGAVHYSAACTPKPNHADRGPLPAELGRMAPDTLAMNAPLDNARCAALLNCKIYHPDIFRVYLLDDLVDHLPEDNPAYQNLPAQLVRERLRLGLGAAQRLIVSTEPLLEAYSHLIDDIHVIPNTLNREDWSMLHSRRRQGQKLRVGWAGAQQHAGDLRVIIDVVKATYQEVDWVFFGMMPEEIKAYVAEFHPFEHGLAAYRRQLAALDLDLAVAPLQIHPFNKAKSNLRLLEYGILGWPVICTDIFPYQTNNPPVTRLANHTQTWITAIRDKVSAPDALAQEGDALRAWVMQHYLMEQHIDKWKRALLR